MNQHPYRKMVKNLESKDYEQIAKRAKVVSTLRLLHAITGVADEAGELVKQIKGHIFYGNPLSKVNIIEELGDMRWFMELAFDVLGVTMDDIEHINYNKLKKRYPDGFTEDKAINRNIDAEREVLEDEESKL